MPPSTERAQRNFDTQQKSIDQERQSREQDRLIDNIRQRLNIIKPGTHVSQTDFDDAQKAGLGAALTEDPVVGTGPKTWTWAGSASAQQAAQNEADRVAASKESADLRRLAMTNTQDRGGDARLDRSYNKEVSRIDSVAKPVLDRADRLQRLKLSLDAQSPQADALIAPELLTAMAGGQGSGLRMNEAEISRIVGGRSKWESLKASMNQWSLDPSKALSITL